jgi:hypothetical protein
MFLKTHTAHKNVIFLSTECDCVYTVLCTDIANKNVLFSIISEYILYQIRRTLMQNNKDYLKNF